MTDGSHHIHFHFGRNAETDQKLDLILGLINHMRTDMAKASAQEAQMVQALITDVGQLLDQVATLRQSVENADSTDDPQVVANLAALTELDTRVRSSLQTAQGATANVPTTTPGAPAPTPQPASG